MGVLVRPSVTVKPSAGLYVLYVGPFVHNVSPLSAIVLQIMHVMTFFSSTLRAAFFGGDMPEWHLDSKPTYLIYLKRCTAALSYLIGRTNLMHKVLNTFLKKVYLAQRGEENC